MAEADEASAPHTDASHHGTPTNRKLAGASPTRIARPRGPFPPTWGPCRLEGQLRRRCLRCCRSEGPRLRSLRDRRRTRSRAATRNPRTPRRRPRWTPPCAPGRADARRTRARRERTRARCIGRSPRRPKAQRPRPPPLTISPAAGRAPRSPGRRDARHSHLPLAAQRGQDAHRHKVADARYEAHRDDDSHCTLSSFTAI